MAYATARTGIAQVPPFFPDLDFKTWDFPTFSAKTSTSSVVTGSLAHCRQGINLLHLQGAGLISMQKRHLTCISGSLLFNSIAQLVEYKIGYSTPLE